MKSKRAQTEIIVTVLIVLIALAAVAFVATFIMDMVKSGSVSAEFKTECIKVPLAFDIISATNASVNNVVVQRTGDEGLLVSGLLFYINDAKNQSSTLVPKVLEKSAYNVSGVTIGSIVKVYAVMNSTGKPCEKNPLIKTATSA